MAKYTINLARARKFSRRKRAKKAMAVLRQELERREGEEVSISPEINVELWKNGVENPPGKIEVEVQDTPTGKVAVMPGSEPEPEPEPEPREDEEEEPEEGGEDDRDEEYEDALSGTVSEAKEIIGEMDDPDYSRLLELEEKGKDRKTLKGFLEDKV